MSADLVIRDAGPGDLPAMTVLIDALGYQATPDEVGVRLARLRESGQAALLAERDGAVLGLLTTSIMQVLHRPKPVGRISMLVVDPKARSGGIGAALVAEAEKRLAAAGCGLVEVTSNMKRERAHGFYLRLGYEQTSFRFARTL